MMLTRLLFASLLVAGTALVSASPSSAVFNILSFGAVANLDTDAAAEANSLAIQHAFAAASDLSANGARHSSEQYWNDVAHVSDAVRSDDEYKLSSSLSSSPLFDLQPAQVLLPANSTFYLTYTPLQNFSNVLFTIGGNIVANSNQTRWAQLINTNGGDFGMFEFINCHGISIQGKTATYSSASTVYPTSAPDIDGRGWAWWVAVITGKPDHRPHLVYFQTSTQISMHSLYVTNSPQFHFVTRDCADLYFGSIVIYVDIVSQKALTHRAFDPIDMLSAHALDAGLDMIADSEVLEPFARMITSLPTFPLNTDGIDPSARNVLIEKFYIENYDDAVAVKPCDMVPQRETNDDCELMMDGTLCTCSSNVTVRSGAVKYSVGLTIGSVPPRDNVNCVSDVTFQDIVMTTPIKGIYVKTNPGSSGSGNITNIAYMNIKMTNPIWYPMWIGPQQQQQPGNGGTGCSFFYPVNGTCFAQPLITINGISLTNVTITGGITLPGVVLCAASNPCTNINFDDVNNSGLFVVQKQYVCKNVQGKQQSSTPTLNCLHADDEFDADSEIETVSTQ